jgi:hypothetical protein
MKRKKLKPYICGQCIYYKDGFCWRNEEEPEAKYYNEVACIWGKNVE